MLLEGNVSSPCGRICNRSFETQKIKFPAHVHPVDQNKKDKDSSNPTVQGKFPFIQVKIQMTGDQNVYVKTGLSRQKKNVRCVRHASKQHNLVNSDC